MDVKKFYSLIRKNIGEYIPDWAKNICDITYLSSNEFKEAEGPGLDINLTKAGIKMENGEIPEIKIGLKEMYEQISEVEKEASKNPLQIDSDKNSNHSNITDGYEKIFKIIFEELIRGIWIDVVKTVINFSFLIFSDEETLEDIKENNMPYFDFRDLHVAYGFTLNHAPNDILVADNKTLDNLHITTDMLYELIINEINNPEVSLQFEKGQAAIYSDLGSELEHNNIDDQHIKSVTYMAEQLEKVNAYFVGFDDEVVLPSNILLSENRLHQIASKLKCQGFYIILLGEESDLLVIPNFGAKQELTDSICKISECWDERISDSVYYYNDRIGFLFDINEKWCSN